jgi:hypothetical protein
MSIGPSAVIAGSLAAPQLAGPKSADAERAQQETVQTQRAAHSEARAEAAAGLGAAEQEGRTSPDRDADGRQLWHFPPARPEEQQDPSQTLPPDPLGQRGKKLDLTG